MGSLCVAPEKVASLDEDQAAEGEGGARGHPLGSYLHELFQKLR